MADDIVEEEAQTDQDPGQAPLWLAVLPLIFLVIGLSFCVRIFGEDTTGGPAQICLIVAGFMTAGLLRWRLKIRWQDLEEQVLASIGFVAQAIFILLLVGSLIGVWILGGIVPSLMVYGLYILKPAFFLPATLIICATASMATGSSWSTAGTLGLALVGVGIALGIPAGMAAGAVISGSYFGDKLSPFSETTNLASSIAGVNLFVHIRHMLYSTLPPFILSFILFIWLGWTLDASAYDPATVGAVQKDIADAFLIHPLLLLPILLLFFLVYKRIPAMPALFLGILMGVLCAIISQPDALHMMVPQLASNQDSISAQSALQFSTAFKAVLQTAATGFQIKAGPGAYRLPDGTVLVDQLLSRGGMQAMLGTIWLILSAMFFSGIMEGGGLLGVLVQAIRRLARSSAALLSATLTTAIGMNIIASEQYLSIVITGRMYQKAFKDQGLAAQNLSRVLEDGGTITSPLVPWNTCGAYMATTLGVATLDYLPYAFFNWLGPLVSLLLAWTGWSIVKAKQELKHIDNIS